EQWVAQGFGHAQVLPLLRGSAVKVLQHSAEDQNCRYDKCGKLGDFHWYSFIGSYRMTSSLIAPWSITSFYYRFSGWIALRIEGTKSGLMLHARVPVGGHTKS